MKKIVYLFLIVLCVSSCADVNTPDVPSNEENPTENNNSTGGNNNQGGSIVKPKYLKQNESYYVYQDESVITDTNVYKTIYERGTDCKYVKSIRTYVNNDLTVERSYQNSNNADFGLYTFVRDNQSLVGTGADTTYWYDEARTLPQKTFSNGITTIYDYNKEGLEIAMSQLLNNQLLSKRTYSYIGDCRYGITKSYDSSTGEVFSIGYDTLIFENRNKLLMKEYKYYCKSETNTYVNVVWINIDYTNCEYGVKQYTQTHINQYELKQNGVITTNKSKYVANYTYQDDLHFTLEQKNYDENQKLLTTFINKYTYVR